MGFFKQKSEKELKAELATLRSKAKKAKLKKEISELKYGKYVKGAKTIGVGAGKGAIKFLDWMIPPQRKGKKRKQNDFLDIGF